MTEFDENKVSATAKSGGDARQENLQADKPRSKKVKTAEK